MTILIYGYDATCASCDRRADASEPAHNSCPGDGGAGCGAAWTGIAPAYERAPREELDWWRREVELWADHHRVPVVAPMAPRYTALDEPVEWSAEGVTVRFLAPPGRAAAMRRRVRPRWWERRRVMRTLTGGAS